MKEKSNGDCVVLPDVQNSPPLMMMGIMSGALNQKYSIIFYKFIEVIIT